jgi:hypothetical protein
MNARMRQGVSMARIPASAHIDIAETTSARRDGTSSSESDPVSAQGSAEVPGGNVLLDGRVAQIVGFVGGTVKLRFADGSDTSVALADYVLQARAVHPARGSGVSGTAPIMPWQPTGQRARRVREMLDGYTAGRRAALHELTWSLWHAPEPASSAEWSSNAARWPPE